MHEIIYRTPKSFTKIKQGLGKAELKSTFEMETPKTKLDEPVKIKKPAKVPKISLEEFWIEKEADEVKLH